MNPSVKRLIQTDSFVGILTARHGNVPTAVVHVSVAANPVRTVDTYCLGKLHDLIVTQVDSTGSYVVLHLPSSKASGHVVHHLLRSNHSQGQ